MRRVEGFGRFLRFFLYKFFAFKIKTIIGLVVCIIDIVYKLVVEKKISKYSLCARLDRGASTPRHNLFLDFLHCGLYSNLCY